VPAGRFAAILGLVAVARLVPVVFFDPAAISHLTQTFIQSLVRRLEEAITADSYI